MVVSKTSSESSNLSTSANFRKANSNFSLAFGAYKKKLSVETDRDTFNLTQLKFVSRYIA